MATAGNRKEEHQESYGSEFVYDCVCQPCQSDGNILEAEGLCADCQEYLCKRCFDSHTIPSVTRHHVLLDKVQISNKDKCTERCSQHHDKIIEYYCKNHSFLGCTLCKTKEHSSCKGLEYIPDVANKLTNSIEFQEYKKQLTSIDSQSKKAAKDVEEQIEMVNRNHDEALKAVREFRKEINDALDKIEDDINKKTEQLKLKEMKKLDNIKEKFNTITTENQDIISYMENLQRKSQYCNMYTMVKQTKERLDILKGQLKVYSASTKAIDSTFKHNMKLLDMLKESNGLGELVSITGFKHTANINVSSKTDKTECRITGCTILPDNQSIIVADNANKNIKMCSIKKGSVTSELQLEQGPWDIINTGDSQVVVTVPYERKIYFISTVSAGRKSLFSKPNQVLTVDRYIKVKDRCHGVAQCNNGRLIVSFAISGRVEIMKLDGTKLSTFVKDNKGNDLFSNPYYVTVSTDNKTMYVSNYGTSTVVCLRLDGTVIATYKDSQLSHPMKVVVDGDGMIYICGQWSKNIHQVTGDCRKIKVLMTRADGLQRPNTICYNETEGKFYVGNLVDNTINIFQALHTPLPVT